MLGLYILGLWGENIPKMCEKLLIFFFFISLFKCFLDWNVKLYLYFSLIFIVVISGITNKPVSAVTAYTADVSQIKCTSSMNPATMSMDSLYGDVPGFQMLPMIPTSPSTNTYRLLMSKVPPQPHLNKKHKRKEETDSSDEECQTQIERRLSVRQSECAFRYKEIVVKKSKGYTQIWLNTHTELRNALNPQVSSFYDIYESLFVF